MGESGWYSDSPNGVVRRIVLGEAWRPIELVEDVGVYVYVCARVSARLSVCLPVSLCLRVCILLCLSLCVCQSINMYVYACVFANRPIYDARLDRNNNMCFI